MKTTVSRFALLCTSALCLSGIASANIVPTLISSNLTAPGIYTYVYDVELDNQQNLVNGSQFCLADIKGLVSGSVTAPSMSGPWSTSVSSGGCPIPAGVTSGNSGTSLDFTYSGKTVIGPSDLGDVTFQDIFSASSVVNVGFGGSAQKQIGGTPTLNQGDVQGPMATPEPMSMTLMGSALLGLGLVRRKSRS